MNRRLSYSCLFLALLFWTTVLSAQTVSDYPPHYYQRQTSVQRQPVPLPFVRESDVVWEHYVWRTIDLREKFNQFFYFPLEHKGIDGRKNLAYVVWDAVVANEIPIYADDDLKIPLDNDAFVEQFMRADTVVLEIVDDDENYEYQTILVPKEFNSEHILQLNLKELWYIEKQTTDQYVRILSLCITMEYYKEHDGDLDYMGSVPLFYVPLLSPSVRQLLVRNEAYVEDNIANQPSWENIFITRKFNSYVTRESNVFNRSVFNYLTGIDAILESERIENSLHEISQDMWEW